MTVVVAACQISPVFGDPEANRKLVADNVSRAAAQGAQVVVLPELVTAGYAFADRAEAATHAEDPDGPSVSAWVDLAQRHGLIIVGGFCEHGPEGTVYNSSAIVDETGVRAVYRKTHLWERERFIFTAGHDRPPVVETTVGKLSTIICYDLEFPEWVRLPALDGAQLLAAPVNWPSPSWPWPGPAGERPGEVVRVQADAGMNRMCVVACDRVGEERGVQWVGGSVICDADGWVKAGGHASVESAVLLADLDLQLAKDKKVGEFSDVHADRRPELYVSIGE